MNKKRYDLVLGIDISKNWLDVSINKKVIRVQQSKTQINRLIKQYQLQTKDVLVVMESTGGYERLAVECFSERGLRVHVAHPNRIRSYAQARGYLAKTDQLDAKIIEGYGWFLDPANIHELVSKEVQQLSDWSHHLSQLKESHHRESCRVTQTRDKEIKKSLTLLLNTLKKQMNKMEAKMLELVQSSEELKNRYEILCSMKGVGPVLAMTLLAELPELGCATKKEIAALVGVAPLNRESGMRIRKAYTHYGRQSVRRILYMAALVATRYNNRLKTFYQTLLAKGKAKKVALVAVMRKMIVILNAMVQKNTVFSA